MGGGGDAGPQGLEAQDWQAQVPEHILEQAAALDTDPAALAEWLHNMSPDQAAEIQRLGNEGMFSWMSQYLAEKKYSVTMTTCDAFQQRCLV